MRAIRDAYNSNPAVKEFIRRIFTELDENVRYRIIQLFRQCQQSVCQNSTASPLVGVGVPFTITVDPTSNCNLRCQGWAGAQHHTLSFEGTDRIGSKELGIHLSPCRGEPLLWPHLARACAAQRCGLHALYQRHADRCGDGVPHAPKQATSTRRSAWKAGAKLPMTPGRASLIGHGSHGSFEGKRGGFRDQRDCNPYNWKNCFRISSSI